MFGKNPKRPPEKGDGRIVQVQEIFYTFQGEGIYAGWPAVFVRLGGCNLACDFCDTEFEDFRAMEVEEVQEAVQALLPASKGAPLVVLTGGEPFRQPIAPLCDTLLNAGYHIQVETNGTLYRALDERVDIICSPKAPYSKLRPDILGRVSALKFIVSASHPDYQHVPDVGQSEAAIPIYVQPMDEYDPVKNKANQDYAVKLVLAHGFRLSLQLHKIAGVP